MFARFFMEMKLDEMDNLWPLSRMRGGWVCHQQLLCRHLVQANKHDLSLWDRQETNIHRVLTFNHMHHGASFLLMSFLLLFSSRLQPCQNDGDKEISEKTSSWRVLELTFWSYCVFNWGFLLLFPRFANNALSRLRIGGVFLHVASFTLRVLSNVRPESLHVCSFDCS